MLFDLLEVDRVPESRGLIEVAGVAPQVLEGRERLTIALEVAEVDGIEADEGREQTDIRLGDGLTHEEP